MSKYLEPIDTEFESNEGFKYDRTEAQIISDLVERVNTLIAYIGERDKLTKSEWDKSYELPE